MSLNNQSNCSDSDSENNSSPEFIQIAQFTNGKAIFCPPHFLSTFNSHLFSPSDLTLYTSPFPLFRLGKPLDGGYILSEIPSDNPYSIIISAGIADDISFEIAFCDLFPKTFCLAFDGTITNPPDAHPNIYFIKKNIDINNTPTTTNLSHFMDTYDNIFLKLDIEGYEIPWIMNTTSEHLSKISQIVLEFHQPYIPYAKDLFKKINETHYLIHFHPNNACSYLVHNGVLLPNVFECTYLNKKFFTSPPSLNTQTLPLSIDMPNQDDKPVLFIDFKPFVHKTI